MFLVPSRFSTATVTAHLPTAGVEYSSLSGQQRIVLRVAKTGIYAREFRRWSRRLLCCLTLRANAVRSAVMKRGRGMSGVRYRVIARNARHHRFVVVAMNMKRALVRMTHPCQR